MCMVRKKISLQQLIILHLLILINTKMVNHCNSYSYIGYKKFRKKINSIIFLICVTQIVVIILFKCKLIGLI